MSKHALQPVGYSVHGVNKCRSIDIWSTAAVDIKVDKTMTHRLPPGLADRSTKLISKMGSPCGSLGMTSSWLSGSRFTQYCCTLLSSSVRALPRSCAASVRDASAGSWMEVSWSLLGSTAHTVTCTNNTNSICIVCRAKAQLPAKHHCSQCCFALPGTDSDTLSLAIPW